MQERRRNIRELVSKKEPDPQRISVRGSRHSACFLVMENWLLILHQELVWRRERRKSLRAGVGASLPVLGASH